MCDAGANEIVSLKSVLRDEWRLIALSSRVKSAISKGIGSCPGFLRKPIWGMARKRREILYRLDMIFSPQKTTVFCPCCGIKFRSFVEGDYLDRPERFNRDRYTHTRQDVHCPFCQSMPRHRILASWCADHKTLLQKSKILYFATEKSMVLWLKRNKLKYTSADLYKKRDLQLDIQATGLPDESYDVVIANYVLEHVDDFRVALRELNRILTPGGSLICSFPMDLNVELIEEDPNVDTPEEQLRLYGQNDHKRIFGMHADQFLEEAGFAVETIKGEDYPEEILPVVGPADYDMNILFWCKKV